MDIDGTNKQMRAFILAEMFLRVTRTNEKRTNCSKKTYATTNNKQARKNGFNFNFENFSLKTR